MTVLFKEQWKAMFGDRFLYETQVIYIYIYMCMYVCQHLIKPYITEMMAGLNPICFVHLHVKPLSDRQLQWMGRDT